MEASPKEGPPRSRLFRSVPPADSVEMAALGSRVLDEEVPRFRDSAAPLAVLTAELRRARAEHDAPRAASLSLRLARQQLRRGIELRDAIALLEKAAEVTPEPALLEELGELWAGVGDFVRGAAYLGQAVDRESGSARARLLSRIGLCFAQGGKVPQALQAFRQAILAAPGEPEPYERLGAMGFWADFPAYEAAQAYLEAARLHKLRGEDGPALESLLRAFEIDPASRTAADTLAGALSERGRAGAADEILREHLRHGSAAARAAHYERTFQAVLAQGKWALALEAALEAELDLELDPLQLESALDDAEKSSTSGISFTPSHFEGFLVWLALGQAFGPGERFAEWLGILVSLHVGHWGRREVERLVRRIRGVCSISVREVEPLSAEQLRTLRAQLTRPSAPEEMVELRLRVAMAEVTKGAFAESFEVIEPVLAAHTQASFESLAVCALVAGRARQSRARAHALSLLARHLPDEAGAVVSAVAAEILLAEGRVLEAARAAQFAVVADPASPRAMATQALVALSHPEQASPGQVEASLAVLVARGDACRLLAQSAAVGSAPHLALSWAERYVLLRPADPLALREVLQRAGQARDAARLAEHIGQALSEPVPIVEVGADIAAALLRLLDLDRDLAEAAGRSVLAKAGIRSLECRQALERIGRDTDRPRLWAELTERLLVVVPAARRPELLLELADARLSAGDALASARALRRALSLGADRDEVGQRLELLGEGLEPDAELARLEVLLELLPDEPERSSSRRQVGNSEKAELLRRLGTMRFDMAQDTPGAIAAWMRAADLDPDLGPERVAHYLTRVAGAEEAPLLLEKAAGQTDDPGRKGRLLGLAARSLLDLKRAPDAFRVAQMALEVAPLQADILTTLERAAAPEDLDRLERIYEMLAEAALGRYGQRAVHYRAARLLERRGRPLAALHHAGLAFSAVPAEGAAFVLMARLADVTSDASPAVAAIERVALSTQDEAERARWLDKASKIASMASGGSTQRVEILLRAAQLRPEQATVSQLETAVLDLGLPEGAERAALAVRLSALVKEAQLHASGAHGAHLCLALASLCLRALSDALLAHDCLLKAVDCDVEVPEYAGLAAPLIEAGAATAWGEELFERALRTSARGQSFGRGLAELLATLAKAAGNQALAADVLVRAAVDAPEDVELVAFARGAALEAGRPDLLARVSELLAPEERVNLVLSRLDSMPGDEALTALLDLDLVAIGDELKIEVLRQLVRRLLAASRLAEALDVLRELRLLVPGDSEILADLARVAAETSDHEELASVLKLQAERATDAAERKRLLLERARLLDRDLSRIGEARELLETLLLAGDDAAVLDLLAESLERSGDAERAGELWVRARAVSSPPVGDGFAKQAARAFGEAGFDRRALDLLVPLDLDTEHQRLVLDLSRRLHDRQTELSALSVLAPLAEPEHRAEAFLAAARLADELGDLVQAEELSRRAALETGADAALARIFSWQVSVRRQPLAGVSAAERLLAELPASEEVSGASQREIRAYLEALATRVARGDAAAREVLSRAIEEQGSRPLIACSLAELLEAEAAALSASDAATESVQALLTRALSLYESAIGGDLHGLRREGDLLLAAAEVARSLGDVARARGFASAVGDEDVRRGDASRLLEDVAAEEAQKQRLDRERREAEELRRIEETARAEKKAQEERETREREARERERVRQEEIQARVAQELAAAEAAAGRREAGARLREQERTRAEAERAERERLAREARDEARRADEQARRRVSLGPDVALGAPRSEVVTTQASESLAAPDPARLAREEVLRLAREEAARERALAPAAEARRSSVQPPASRPGSPGRSRVAVMVGRRPADGLERMADLLEPPEEEETSIVHVGELREVDELTPAEEAIAVHPGGPQPRKAESSAGVPSSTQGTRESEEALLRSLERGDVEAGIRLLDRLQTDRGRAGEAVVVAGHLVVLCPGDGSLLGRLVAAASRDGNEALALAVRHVLGSFGAGDRVSAPPLERIVEQPERAQAVLFRGARGAGAEALALVWEHAGALFRRDAASYGVTGTDRVPVTAPTPLGELYRDATRLFGMTRTPLFRAGTGEDISMRVALLSPPAVLVTGRIDQTTPELSFHFGAALGAARPEHALLYGLEADMLEDLLGALRMSFGNDPQNPESPPSQRAVRYASLLWEAIPPRVQRRLSQLCADREQLDLDLCMGYATAVLRRAGLLVSGDVKVAVVDVCESAGVPVPRSLSELAEAARFNPAMADLLQLAVSPEYAELRFRSVQQR